ncbi:signal transduction histidine kinase/ActR/RegA family two-component response regulator [Massilia sp. MP_M2]|uniref:hybrid sensor histidine kinase/response regulator n=1 Tax=Massilia sp. MP_M2 TaxID=3071713 RepID=UPI00319D897A
MPMTTPAPLQDADGEHDALIEQNAILCSANQHLLLATLDAEDLRAQAEAANRRQNEFLAMLAHELRNPLAPISMASAMMGKLPEPSTELLHIKAIIERQVGQLSRLLDDLLDAARISSGKIELHKQALLVAEQLANAVDTVQARVNDRRQQLSIEVPDHAIWVFGDAVRLAQVFSNLLVNASKFTPIGGSIALRVGIVGNDVVVTVEDDGDGIAADVLPTVFTLFTQGPRTLARSQGGLGIGLNIVRNVVEMHGGSVSAASPGLGHGTVFTVRLPLLEVTDAPLDVVPDAVAPPLRHHILLVEDNLDASEMLEMVLCSENHTVIKAFDGVAGLALACTGAFDVVLCDIGLPKMTGYDLVRTLRATLAQATPFCVAISGYGQPEDRARALASGFDEHLLKPINIDNLLQLVASVPLKTAHAPQPSV